MPGTRAQMLLQVPDRLGGQERGRASAYRGIRRRLARVRFRTYRDRLRRATLPEICVVLRECCDSVC